MRKIGFKAQPSHQLLGNDILAHLDGIEEVLWG